MYDLTSTDPKQPLLFNKNKGNLFDMVKLCANAETCIKYLSEDIEVTSKSKVLKILTSADHK